VCCKVSCVAVARRTIMPIKPCEFLKIDYPWFILQATASSSAANIQDLGAGQLSIRYYITFDIQQFTATLKFPFT
jgi:hypothetical protein